MNITFQNMNKKTITIPSYAYFSFVYFLTLILKMQSNLQQYYPSFYTFMKAIFPGSDTVPPKSGTWILDLSHDPIWAIWFAVVRQFHQHHDRIALHTYWSVVVGDNTRYITHWEFGRITKHPSVDRFMANANNCYEIPTKYTAFLKSLLCIHKVGSICNAIQYDMLLHTSLQWLRQYMNYNLNTRKTTYILT